MKISACYIVRNNARELEKSLQSLRQNVDEIIVVDTGSEDETIAVAQRYGAQVAEHPWQDDFAAARNAALALATGDWVVFLDADEYFSVATAGNLRQVIETAAADALLVQICNIDQDTQEDLADFFALRIFRRELGRCYAGRIHEQLLDAGQAVVGQVVPPQELAIIHTGYSACFSKEKAARNLRLLRMELGSTKTPQRLYMYLAEAYDGLDDREQALHYAYLDIANGRQPVSFASRSYRILLRRLVADPAAWEERLRIASRAVADFPELPEFQAELAECKAYTFDYPAAIAAGQQALALLAAPAASIEPVQFDQDGAAVLQQRIALWQQIQKQMETLRISACVIVRNEAANIGKWLADAGIYSDEMIVVDTGSTDATVRLAEQGGAKVYHFTWQDDFAAARNFALDQAGGDWIAFLDADEYLAQPERVRPLLAELAVTKPQVDGLMVPIANIDADDRNREIQRFINLRFFRHISVMRYAGKVHESVRRIKGETQLQVEAERLLIYHTGYSGSRLRQKAARNLKLLQAEIAEQGEQPQYYSYLADCYFGLKDYKKSLFYAKKAIASPIQRVGSGSDMYHEALECMRQLALSNTDMLALMDEAVDRFPRLPDFYAERGMVLCGLQQWSAAIASLEKAVQLGTQPLDDREASYYRGIAPIVWRRLGGLYLQIGQQEKAETALAHALQGNKYQPEALALYLQLHEAEPVAQVMDGLAVFYTGGTRDTAWLARQLEKLGMVDLYESYAAQNNEENQWLRDLYGEVRSGDRLAAWQRIEKQAAADVPVLFQSLFVLAGEKNFWQQTELQKKYLPLLPDGMQAVLCRYAGAEEKLAETDKEGYLAGIPLAAAVASAAQREHYARLALDFTGEGICAAAHQFYLLRYWVEARQLYEVVPADSPAVDAAFWHDVGICYYYQQQKETALACFVRARQLGADDAEMASYEYWLGEGGEA